MCCLFWNALCKVEHNTSAELLLYNPVCLSPSESWRNHATSNGCLLPFLVFSSCGSSQRLLSVWVCSAIFACLPISLGCCGGSQVYTKTRSLKRANPQCPPQGGMVSGAEGGRLPRGPPAIYLAQLTPERSTQSARSVTHPSLPFINCLSLL